MDLAGNHEPRTLSGHSGAAVDSVAFSADGRTLASASWDNTLKLWDAQRGLEKRTLKGHRDLVESLKLQSRRPHRGVGKLGYRRSEFGTWPATTRR